MTENQYKDWTGIESGEIAESDIIGKIHRPEEYEYTDLIEREIVRRAFEYSGTRQRIIESGENAPNTIPDIDEVLVSIQIGERVVEQGDPMFVVNWEHPFIWCEAVNVRLRTSDKKCYDFASDLATARPKEERIEEAGLIITNENRLEPDTLSLIIERAFGSEYVNRIKEYEVATEIEYDFRTGAMSHAARALLDEDEAREESVRIAIERHVLGYTTVGVKYNVTIEDKKVTVNSLPV